METEEAKEWLINQIIRCFREGIREPYRCDLDCLQKLRVSYTRLFHRPDLKEISLEAATFASFLGTHQHSPTVTKVLLELLAIAIPALERLDRLAEPKDLAHFTGFAQQVRVAAQDSPPPEGSIVGGPMIRYDLGQTLTQQNEKQS